MPDPKRPVFKTPEQTVTKRCAFVLLNCFSLLSFASALDAIRIANRMAGRDLYSDALSEGAISSNAPLAPPSKWMMI